MNRPKGAHSELRKSMITRPPKPLPGRVLGAACPDLTFI